MQDAVAETRKILHIRTHVRDWQVGSYSYSYEVDFIDLAVTDEYAWTVLEGIALYYSGGWLRLEEDPRAPRITAADFARALNDSRA